MKSRRILSSVACISAALLLAVSPPALAKKQAKAPPPPSAEIQALAAAVPQHTLVQSFYSRWQGPAWFADEGKPARELIQILRRAPLDGFAAGPALATQAEKAMQIAAANENDRSMAQQVLSAAWVGYVQSIRQPVGNMIYGYPALAPKPGDAAEILTSAAAAPSLEQYLTTVASINPLYADLRETAWRQMQASPGAASDPRIQINLARLRAVPTANRFALVNVATQRLEMYENGRAVDSMKVIVGTKELPTPMITSVIYYATFNPYWNVPDHLIRKTVAPNVVRQGLPYLKARGYQVMTDWTADAAVIPSEKVDWKGAVSGAVKIRVRQLPGPQNSMGRLKFSFANGQDIFLHDTPSKDLFGKAERDLSNGCIRLEDARRFGRWLLGREPVAPNAEPEQYVQLPQGVPVYVTYLTAQPTAGKITYSADIYGWDRASGSQAAVSAPAVSGALSAK